MKIMSRNAAMNHKANSVGLYIYTYSPGDGITHYRFSYEADSDYFACNAIRTVLGYKEAELFVNGYRAGYWKGYNK